MTAYSYDPDGHVLQSQQSASGTVLRSTAATYTLTGKPATATDANNNTTSFSYDLLDRLASVKDAMGRTTSYGYDALSRQSSISNLAIQNTPLLQQAYTPDGLLASLTDANNHATSFAYDGFDRLATTTYPLGTTEVLTYDADSNVSTRKTRANQTIGFAYDTLNRLKTKTPPAPAAVVSYTYDLAGRPISVSKVRDRALPAQRVITVARRPAHGVLHARDAIEKIVGEARGIVVGIGRGRRLAGQRVGRACAPKHGAAGGLLALNDVPVRVVAVGRHQAVRRGRRGQAAGRVIGAGCDVCPRIGDGDGV